MSRWTLRILLALAVVAAIALARETFFTPENVPVDVVDVQRGPVEETVTNSRAGTVKARLRAKMSPEIGGQVLELPFREGERVAAGDLLLRLDDTSQRAALTLARRDREAAEAEAERACLGAERAARELERTRRLADDGIVSADLLDQIESGRAGADATCNAARSMAQRAAAAEGVADADLAKTRLLAPFDGRVAEVAAEVGEWVTPSPPALPVPPVLDLLDPGSVYVSAAMDEVDSARILAGQPVRVTVDSHRGREIAGRVRRVAPYVLDVEEQNRTVEIEVDLVDPDPDLVLLPGTSADVEVILETREDVLRIPTAALIEGSKVLVVEDGVLVERPVETGLRNWDWVEVRSGVREGDNVVVSLDRAEVEPGARVDVRSRPERSE